MKVLMINGSCHENGSTFALLREIADELHKNAVETEIVQLGNGPQQDCVGCGGCRRSGTGRCVFDNDIVNVIIDKAKTADGFVFGTPVYYAHPSGRLLSVLDRAFYAGSAAFAFKPGAAVAVARRAGTTASIDVLNKYFTIAKMPVVSSTYWNIAHGVCASEVPEDEEGLQTMRNLARNMAWMLNSLSKTTPPENEKAHKTNFVR